MKRSYPDNRDRHTRAMAALCAGLLVLLIPPLAVADAQVAPLVPVFSPPKAAELITRFHDALAEGLQKGGAKVVQAALVRAKAKTPCAKARCARAQARAVGTSTLVGMQVETVGKNYTFSLTVLPGGKPATEGRCDVCTLMEALNKTKQLGATLAKMITANPPPTKSPATATPAASAAAAKTPSKKAKTTASKPRPATESLAKQDPTVSERSHWPLWPSLAAAGVGVLGLAVGLPLLSMDGEPTNCRGAPRPDGRNCEDLYSTSGPGWTLTAMGIAGTVTAGVLFYLYFSSSKKEASSRMTWLVPHVTSSGDGSGWMLGAVGSF